MAELHLNISKPRKKFKDSMGQANHFLITALIGLDYIDNIDNVECPPSFSTSWNPRDKKASIYRTRQYILNSSLAWSVDCLDSYFSGCNQEPKLIDNIDFIKDLDNCVEKLKMDKNMIHRVVNKGFSGGERKKNEILQMYMLNPSLVMLDEIDSGLDVDSLKIVGENVMEYYKENKPAMLVITHYQRLLDYIKPTHVHIMKNGKIVKSGDISLVNLIETVGYEKIDAETSEPIVSEVK